MWIKIMKLSASLAGGPDTKVLKTFNPVNQDQILNLDFLCSSQISFPQNLFTSSLILCCKMLNYAGAVPDDHNDHKNSSEDEVSSYENDFWLAANRIQKTPISNRLKQTGFVSSLDYPTQLIFKKIYSLWSGNFWLI